MSEFRGMPRQWDSSPVGAIDYSKEAPWLIDNQGDAVISGEVSVRSEEDADILAAAAEMYSALKNAVDYLDGPMGEITDYEGDQHIIEPMRAALAKANGTFERVSSSSKTPVTAGNLQPITDYIVGGIRELNYEVERLSSVNLKLLDALKRLLALNNPLIGNQPHAKLVAYWEYEKSQGRGEAEDMLFALSVLAEAAEIGKNT